MEEIFQAADGVAETERAHATRLAGFWIRAVASLIDEVILDLTLVAMALWGLLAYGLASREPLRPDMGSVWAVWVLYGMVSVALKGFYHAYLVGACGQSLGKMALGIRVERPDGRPVGYGRALWRWAAYILSALPMGLGFLLIALPPWKRGLHDWVAGTRVVRLP